MWHIPPSIKIILHAQTYFRILFIRQASAFAAAASARSAAASALSAAALESAAAASAFRAAASALEAEAFAWSAYTLVSSKAFLQGSQHPAPMTRTNAMRMAKAKPLRTKAFLIFIPPFQSNCVTRTHLIVLNNMQTKRSSKNCSLSDFFLKKMCSPFLLRSSGLSPARAEARPNFCRRKYQLLTAR